MLELIKIGADEFHLRFTSPSQEVAIALQLPAVLELQRRIAELLNKK